MDKSFGGIIVVLDEIHVIFCCYPVRQLIQKIPILHVFVLTMERYSAG